MYNSRYSEKPKEKSQLEFESRREEGTRLHNEASAELQRFSVRGPPGRGDSYPQPETGSGRPGPHLVAP